jgi:hypothetical protein
MPKGQGKYKHKSTHDAEYISGKWYHLDDLEPFVTGAILHSMFRKPKVGEETPDGITHRNERSCDMSSYDKCMDSFILRVECHFNDIKR